MSSKHLKEHPGKFALVFLFMVWETRKVMRLKYPIGFFGVVLLIATCAECSHMQRIDGWYNNLLQPSWGTAGEALLHNITPAYEDFTYKCMKNRPGARLVSNQIFQEATAQFSSFSLKRSALFAFFSQFVSLELTNTDDKTCPAEIVDVPVPACDLDFDPGCTGKIHIPYERTAYDKGTGQSPNSPRRQVNKATSFIDASFVYGTSTVRTNFLRKQGTGFLAGSDTWNRFPGSNEIGLPVETCPDAAGKMHDPTKLWMTGDPHAHENPGVLSLSVLFFRWHNVLAKRFQQNQSDLSPTDVFLKARRWVIACLQKIIMYDWLPFLVQQPIKNYTGYNPSLKPSITTIFDAAAMQYYSTLIPNAFQFRNKDTCKIDKEMQPLRLCRTFFNSEEILKNGPFIVEEILMGMASQNAAKDDFQIVEDLRSKWFGPLHFSRRDFVTYTIMRGRDFGLPDYNTARREMDLAEVPDFASINPALNKTNPEVFQKLQNLYKDVKHLDIFVGGMLETTGSGPGELFKMVILDQFYKIRDGDRFWFENEGVMRREEVQEVWNITLRDIILACSEIKSELLQPNVFTIDPVDPACSPINVNTSEMEACPQHKGFDYFAGSEISYIIIWVCFGLIPIVCILCAFIASKCRKWNHDRRKKKHIKHATKQNNQVEIRVNDDDEVRFSATEWQGPKEEERSVFIKLKADCVLEVTSSRGATLRKVNFQNRNTVEAWNSANKGRNVMVIKVPKECDMMFQFQSCAARTLFEKELRGMLMDHNLQLIMQEDKLRGLKKNLFTRSKRNALLEQFFKHVFSEAFDMDYDPSLEESDNMEGSNANEILQIELTKEEFAHALAVKPTSEFVENMFGLLDTNRNGYISFRDFLNAVVLFSKGSSQEKIRLIFRMFDVEDKDQLNKSQLIKMFRSLLEMANSNVVKEDIETLVESICLEHGLNDQSTIDFDDFCKILSPQMDKIWNSSLEWKGRKNCYPSQDRRKSYKNLFRCIDVGMRKKSLSVGNLRRKSSESSDDIMSQKSGSLSTLNSSTKMITKFEAIREKYHPIKSKVKDLLHFFENNRQHIFYLILFFGITVGIFAERFYYYTVEREHSGLRALMSYGISVTRGAAGAMSFTFSLLLLTMCRNMITWLRSTILNQFIPFDSHVTFHKIVAWTALFFTGLHVIGYSFNFYHLTTQPTSHLCIFDSIALRSDTLVNFNFWLFGNMTGFTGVLLVIIICIIYVFATQTARKHIFNGFWLTHKLISIMYILTILHGASRIVQKPLFFVYFIGPAILFAIDKLISLSRKKTEITVIRAEKLQSDITSLEFKRPSKFEYKSGQWVRIACVSQGRNEYHPFTLTSAPHEDTLKLHIRALGPWTWNIRNMYDPEVLKDEPFPKLYLDGPYGAGQQDWYQYEVSILVGAGIGVTPYASILKDFVHMAMMRSTYRMKCQKLYFVWVTASQRHYEWLLDIIREVEEVDEKGIVSVDIFITQFFQNFDLRTTMLYICEEHFQKLSGGHSVFTGLKASTHFGRPKLAEMFRTIHKTHPTARKVGVFSCGPAGVTSSVEAGCIEASNTTKALFEHHFENF